MTLTTADRVELTDLVHRYAAYVDQRRWTEVAELFTSGGRLLTVEPPALDPSLEATGREAIEAALCALQGLQLTVHQLVGVVLDPAADPDEAHGRVATVAHHLSPRGEATKDLIWHLHYDDIYRRTEDGWRIDRRELHVDVVESREVRRARSVSPRA